MDLVGAPGGMHRGRENRHVAAVGDDRGQVRDEAAGNQQDPATVDVQDSRDEEAGVGGEPERDGRGIGRVPGDRDGWEGQELEREREIDEADPAEAEVGEPAEVAAE